MSQRRIKHRPAKSDENGIQAFGVAWYREDQWARLREVSVDRDDLEETYREWLEMAEKSLDKLISMGLRARKIDVDVGALVAWCTKEGLEVNADARANYVAWLQVHKKR